MTSEQTSFFLSKEAKFSGANAKKGHVNGFVHYGCIGRT